MTSKSTEKFMNLGKEEEYLRVVVIGDSAVGKTSIISRLVCGEFSEMEKTTVGAMFVLYTIKLDDDEVLIQLWDTAGQERFRSIGPIYYRNAQCGIIVFDYSRKDTFNDLENWVNTFTTVAGPNASVFIVGNKVDLIEQRQVTDEEVQKWLETHNYPFFSTSAKDGTSINMLFKHVGEDLLKKQSLFKQLYHSNNLDSKKKENNSYCC